MQLEGEIHEIDLVANLVELGREGFTGAIRFERDSVIKIVYFKDGEILSSSTNDRADTIDEILVNAKKIHRDHVKQALARRKETETLGDALLTLGFITRKELAWARRIQLVGILRSVANWDSGSFQIVPDYLPKREEGTRFPLAQIIIELIVTETDRAKVERLLPSTALISRAPDFDAQYAALGLNEEADEIVGHLSGEKTVAEIAAESKSDSFAVFKLILALATLGILTGAGLPQRSLEVSSSSTDFDFDDPPAAGVEESGFHSESSVPAEELYAHSASDVVTTLHPEAPTPYSSAATSPQEDFDVPPGKLDFDPALLAEEPAGGSLGPSEPIAVPVSNSYIRSKTFHTPKKRRSKLPVILLAVLLVGAGAFGSWKYFASSETGVTDAARPIPRAASQVPPSPVPSSTETGSPSAAAAQTTTAQGEAGTSGGSALAATTSAEPAAPPAAAVATPATQQATPSTYRSQAQEFARTAERSQFALQFEVVCQDASVRRAVAEGGSSVWFVPAKVGGRDCFRVLWGRYPSREAAGRAANEIPRGLRSSAPIPVAISRVVQ